MTRSAALAAVFLCLGAGSVAWPQAASAASDAALLARGQYLASIMDCTGCHTTGALRGQPDPARYLAGSDVGFEIPDLGIFYPPNLTSDAETGLGDWTAEQIIAAVRSGERPDGRQLVPIMPWPSYGVLTDEDAAALAAFLKSLPALRFQVPEPVGPGQPAPLPYFSVVVPE
ncbi:MAG: c-type cytochrome [Kiloniellales bacterium]